MREIELEFIRGAARAMFVSEWASIEELHGRTYPGMELMDVAPVTPQYAELEAARLLGKFESANHSHLSRILFHAAVAEIDGEWCGEAQSQWINENAREFGHYIAMQAMGHGVSWFDDHERFAIIVPHFEFELEMDAMDETEEA